MGKLILNPECNLYERGGQPFCSSRQIAETFEKEHRNVLRDVEQLDCSEKFRQLNFELTSERMQMPNGGYRKDPSVLMTKNGFTFLVMGYRGKKAAEFKEAYIERFDKMESFIKSLLTARLEHPAFAGAVMNAYDEPKHYHFSNEADMINRLVLGIPAKKFREANGLNPGESIRPFLSDEQIKRVVDLQRADIGLLVAKIPYDKRKEVLAEYHTQLALASR